MLLGFYRKVKIIARTNVQNLSRDEAKNPEI